MAGRRGTDPRSAPGAAVRADAVVAALADAPDIARSGHRAVFRRIGRNVGWLLGGRGVGGLASIVYLGLAARALGPATFGVFALILAYAGAIAGLAEFKAWQAVVRFGSVHRAAGNDAALARLLGYTATLDVAAGAIGAIIAIACAPLAGRWLGWSPGDAERAALFAAALLMTTGGTATGMLRLFDRFDLLTYAEAAGPLLRVAGAALAWWLGAGIDGFLAAWAVAALAESAAGWIAALGGRLSPLRFGRRAWSAALAENHRLWPFMLKTSLSSSLGLLWQHFGTLAVGASGGAAAAGAFRIASKLASAVSKPVETVTRALYPELARLTAGGERATLKRVVGRTTAAATVLAVSLAGTVWLCGPILLRVFSGRGFEFAQLYLLPLAIAAAIDLSGIALEPLHNACGRPGRILAIRGLGAVVYLAALAALLTAFGPVGAALAAIVSSVVMRVLLALSAGPLLARRTG